MLGVWQSNVAAIHTVLFPYGFWLLHHNQTIYMHYVYFLEKYFTFVGRYVSACDQPNPFLEQAEAISTVSATQF